MTWSGSGCGPIFLARRTSECAPQPWSKVTTRPSSLASPLAQTPKVSLSGPAMRTRKPQEWQWCGAAWAIGGLGAAAAVVPALGGEVATLDREGADPAETEVGGDGLDLRLVLGLERVVAEGVRRHQARVVVGDGQQVAGREVTGLQALAVGHPLGGRDGLLAGDEDDLVDGDGLLAAGAHDGHRPAPPDVALALAGEQVGDDALALGQRREVLADVGGVVDLLEQRRAGQVDGGGGRRVGLAARGYGGREGGHAQKHDR